MASPPDDSGNLWDLIQQWKGFVIFIIGLGVQQGIRMYLNDRRDPASNAERIDRQETNNWISQQDKRMRDRVDMTDAENVRLRTRNEQLEKENTNLEAQVDRERTSGLGHYQKTIRLYDVIVEIVHDWRNGKQPPDKITDYDKI